MEGMGTKKAAEVLHVSQETVARWCREKRIPGAEQDDVGYPWRIPPTFTRDQLLPKKRTSAQDDDN